VTAGNNSNIGNKLVDRNATHIIKKLLFWSQRICLNVGNTCNVGACVGERVGVRVGYRVGGFVG